MYAIINHDKRNESNPKVKVNKHGEIIENKKYIYYNNIKEEKEKHNKNLKAKEFKTYLDAWAYADSILKYPHYRIINI